jgi:1-acyl-sn-glycerol-3-phosphate acyltransferase
MKNRYKRIMLRTILFFAWFWATIVFSAPLSPLFFLSYLFGLGRWTRPLLGRFANAWARSILRAAGISVKIDGLEKIPGNGNICFIANHQGDFDIILILACLPMTVGFLAKRFAAFVPVFGLWTALLGSVFINRKSLRDGKSAIDKGVRSLKKGRALCVFPEGTRSRGPAMNPFRNGSFKMATRSESWIVPVTINGSWQSWEAKKRILPAAVDFIVHEPIDTRGMDADTRKALPDRVRDIIASGLDHSAGGAP